MNFERYIMADNGAIVLEPNLIKWAKWFESADRRVGFERRGDVEVSTVFLGTDHGFDTPMPVLWETLVFAFDGHPLDQYMERCNGSKEQAEEMHRRVCEMVWPSKS